MHTSGIFTTHKFKVSCKPGETLKLIPFGDVHREAPLHSHSWWKRFLDYAKSQKNAIFLGMGDYFDGCSTSERASIARSDLHDSTIANIEDTYKGVTKTLDNELQFMRGRLIGLIGGNHYYEYRDGTTSDMRLCEALGCRFLGVQSLIRVQIDYGKTTMPFDIMAHHGKGGGKLPGSTFNSINDMHMGAEVDICLMGHDHKRGVAPGISRLRLCETAGRLSVKQRVPWLGRTGSFLKGFEDGQVSYNVDACRNPNALGWIEFDVAMVRSVSNGVQSRDIEIRGIS